MNKTGLYKIINALKEQVLKIKKYQKAGNYEMAINEMDYLSIMLSAIMYKIEEEE